MFLLLFWIAVCIITVDILWPGDQFSLKVKHQEIDSPSRPASTQIYSRSSARDDWKNKGWAQFWQNGRKSTCPRRRWKNMSVCVRAGSGRGRETVNVSSVALSAERNPCLIGPAQGSASVCVFVRKYLCSSVWAAGRSVCNHSSGRLLSFRRPGSSCRGNTSNVKRRRVAGGAASQMIRPVWRVWTEAGTRRAGCKTVRGPLCVCVCLCVFVSVCVMHIMGWSRASRKWRGRFIWLQLLMARWKHSANNKIWTFLCCFNRSTEEVLVFEMWDLISC